MKLEDRNSEDEPDNIINKKIRLMWTGYRCSEDEELANSLVCWNPEE